MRLKVVCLIRGCACNGGMVGVKYYVAGYIKAVQNWAHEVIQLRKLLHKFVKMVVGWHVIHLPGKC